jgi:hypothetical protein
VKRIGLTRATFEAPAPLIIAAGEILEECVENPRHDLESWGELVGELIARGSRLSSAAPDELRDEVLRVAAIATAALAGLNVEQLRDELARRLDETFREVLP